METNMMLQYIHCEYQMWQMIQSSQYLPVDQAGFWTIIMAARQQAAASIKAWCYKQQFKQYFQNHVVKFVGPIICADS